MKGFLLFIVAVFGVTFSFLIATTFSLFYYLTHFWKVKQAYNKISDYFLNMALSLDQFGNVNNKDFFNFIMIKKKNRKVIGEDYRDYYNSKTNKVEREYITLYDYHEFGDEDDTISYVIAMNYQRNSLNKFGVFWANFLNFVDKDHLKKAIVIKYYRDIEANRRLEKNNFKQYYNNERKR